MKYVRFTGCTPVDHNYSTYYEEYLAFQDYVEKWQIQKQSLNYALECAERFKDMRDNDMTEQQFKQKCIDIACWEYVSEDEFLASLEE